MRNVKRRAFVPRTGEYAAWKRKIEVHVIADCLGKMNMVVSI